MSDRDGAARGIEGALIVVGGASGIGRAVVEQARHQYSHITVVDVRAAVFDDVTRGVAEVASVVGDVTEPGAFAEVVDEVVKSTGRLDAVATLVGGARIQPFLDLTLDDWHRQLDHNLTSAFLVAQGAGRVMVPQGYGSIVLASSGYGSRAAPPGRVPYSAAKAGVLGLSRSLALELGPHGVRVNVVSPGPTDTPRFRELLTPGEIRSVQRDSALRRLSDPTDTAAAVLFLLSAAARQITGQIIHVNGGAFMPSG